LGFRNMQEKLENVPCVIEICFFNWNGQTSKR
jgi:hypothetical protein